MLHRSESNGILKTAKTPLRRSRLLVRPATIRVLSFLTLVALVILLSIDNLKRLFQNENMIGEEGAKIIQSLCEQHHQQQQSGSNMLEKSSNQLLLEHQRASHTANEEHLPMDTVIDNNVWRDLPVKGAFYMVVDSGDLQHIRASIRSVEDRFNHRFRYPWILLSNQHLTASFRNYITKLTTSPIFFGKIDAELWDYPSWVSGVRAEDYMKYFSSSDVKHATSFLFRQRSRYHAGFFFHHPLLQNVEYAWRVEPGSDYSCIMDTDPFVEMEQRNKTMEREEPLAVRSLYPLTLQFMKENMQLMTPLKESLFPWLVDNKDPMYAKANGFNYCQIESNFMIVKLSYLRSPEYQNYFSFLDSTGGFYYERWNDASVQTMAAAMFLPRSQLHFFNHIGYSFERQMHCPWRSTDLGTCSCDITSATGKWMRVM
ncbi:hypothetical protein O0I10_001726 [Lichtheimia ornata]|uniref:Glycosyltransferase family 15 protein n=1 Tax=Lichtheimia ornata TaxID=688661 RepID=A0AAD7VD20_9FUNG|nr:uncharacterized protein O0I10_001726 [Lichtheimia ornata]KAJ8662762.1 hypothetical protein O0I10_001726 [Lichtheimia ornata]